MVVVGFEHKTFKGNDGNPVSGYNLWLGIPVSKDGDGYRVDRYFVSDKRCERSGFSPKSGMEVNLIFNRHGKIDEILI